MVTTNSQTTTSDSTTPSPTTSTSTTEEQGTTEGELSAAMGILIGIAVLFLVVCADIVHKNYLKEAGRLYPADFDSERTLLEVNSTEMLTITVTTTSADAGSEAIQQTKQEKVELEVEETATQKQQQQEKVKVEAAGKANEEEEQKYDSNIMDKSMSQLSSPPPQNAKHVEVNSDMLLQEMQNTSVPASPEDAKVEEEEEEEEENQSRQTRESNSELETSDELDDEQQDKIGIGLQSVKVEVNKRELQQPSNNPGLYTPQSTRL